MSRVKEQGGSISCPLSLSPMTGAEGQGQFIYIYIYLVCPSFSEGTKPRICPCPSFLPGRDKAGVLSLSVHFRQGQNRRLSVSQFLSLMDKTGVCPCPYFLSLASFL